MLNYKSVGKSWACIRRYSIAEPKAGGAKEAVPQCGIFRREKRPERVNRSKQTAAVPARPSAPTEVADRNWGCIRRLTPTPGRSSGKSPTPGRFWGSTFLPPRDGSGVVPLTCPNIDEFLFLPVAAGMWRQHELWDGTYTLDDLLDIAELIRVRNENQARAAEAQA